ncbi:unnamed protein product [Rotaria sp. Silwood2]|nr:unnamed protein product [Rotaria sp. Silwood2]
MLYHIPLAFCPCDGTQWDFTSNLCGYANCYLVYNKVLSTIDWLANNGSPIVVIIIANVSLVIRIIKHKRRQQKSIPWKKQRRMTLQLLSISSLYLVAMLPSLTIEVTQQLNSPRFLVNFQAD